MKSLILLLFIVLPTSINSQQITWQRSAENVPKPELRLFRSAQVISLPSAETHQKGDFEYEISHRFIPNIDAKNSFLGLDGPATIRFGLSYAPSDKMMIVLARSNQEGNIELSGKYKTLQLHNDLFPTVISIRGGAVWNTKFTDPNRKLFESENFQFFGQLIINTLYERTLGIGIVPTYLYNSSVNTIKRHYSFTFGTYAQVYLSNVWSLILEWNPTVTGYRNLYNPLAFGFEIDTGGGHFFKIFITNSTDINTAQFINGASKDIQKGDISLGFNITRILKF